MPGRKTVWGVGFYGKLMGESLAGEVKSFGRFRAVEDVLVSVCIAVIKCRDQ